MIKTEGIDFWLFFSTCKFVQGACWFTLYLKYNLWFLWIEPLIVLWHLFLYRQCISTNQTAGDPALPLRGRSYASTGSEIIWLLLARRTKHCQGLFRCKLLKLIHLVMEFKAIFQHCLALFRCKLLKLIHLVMEFKAMFQHCLALISCKWSKIHMMEI